MQVMVYSGQLDVIVAYPLTEKYLAAMEWKGANEYREAPRKIWRVDGDVAGYAREVSNPIQTVKNIGCGWLISGHRPTNKGTYCKEKIIKKKLKYPRVISAFFKIHITPFRFSLGWQLPSGYGPQLWPHPPLRSAKVGIRHDTEVHQGKVVWRVEIFKDSPSKDFTYL